MDTSYLNSLNGRAEKCLFLSYFVGLLGYILANYGNETKTIFNCEW